MQRFGVAATVAAIAGILMLAGAALELAGVAQTPARPPAQTPAASQAPDLSGPAAEVQEVQRNYASQKTNILKAADKMPAESYTYKPEPDIRTFARVVNHISEAQLRSCGVANHTPAESLAKVPPETADKTAIVAALQASFAECDKAYAAASPGNLGDMLLFTTLPNGQKLIRSRIGMLWGNVSHDNEQYATLALYLRLKGIAPPTSEK